MRQDLLAKVGKRENFQATFIYYSVRRYGRKLIPTALLINIYDSKNDKVTDHIWIDKRELGKLNLEKFDRISFTAVSSFYLKGYLGHRANDHREDAALNLNVCLAKLREVRKVEKPLFYS